MNESLPLTALSEEERQQALERFHQLQPFLEGQTTLRAVAEENGISLRTGQRWVSRYRRFGLAGLARRRRSDQERRQIEPELCQLIEGLALQKYRPTAAAIHRQIIPIAQEQGWSMPSYSTVYDIVRSLDPGLVTLAHEGSKAYQDKYDLLYRREAGQPNEIWQADHTPLDIWLVDDDRSPARPWLTVIEDDYSRSIAGYYLSFDRPSTLNTSLALRQAIWRKEDPRWPICGIPQIFYTDHGSDFTSNHLEQVAASLKMQLVFSTAGMPRGRGRVERFFLTVNQLFLHQLPGYIPDEGGKPATRPQLSLAAFQALFHQFLLDEYLPRQQKELGSSPKERWEAGGFLPQMPVSLAHLDLLLLTSARTRRVRQDGIHFHNLRYVDTVLTAYIGEDVVIRYDPRDMAEIRVYHQNQFICRAICQELAGETVSLKEIMRSRNRRRRELRQLIKERQAVVDALLAARRQQVPVEVEEEIEESKSKKPTTAPLKRYQHE